MIQDNLIAEASTTIDADTECVTVFGGEQITLGIDGRSTFLTPNEARRIADALTTAAAQAPKRGGAVIVDTPENVIPASHLR